MWIQLQKNWKIYLIEAWGLGMFMISAAFFTILFEHKALPLRTVIEEPMLRRFLIGLAMGGTAVLLIYSPWGKKSGAHMNPAVTLTHLQLNRIPLVDAVWYIIAQFSGGSLGMFLVKMVAFKWIASPEVNYAVTVPGQAGVEVAFLMEMLISFVLFGMVLLLSNHQTLAPFTGFFVGGLIVLYITLEAPISGMSMNPARTFASAWSANVWTAWLLYFTAPIIGMNLAGYLYRVWYRRRHGGNCLTMDCNMSSSANQNKVYRVNGPKSILAKFGYTIHKQA